MSFARLGFAFALWMFVSMTTFQLMTDRSSPTIILSSAGVGALLCWIFFALGMRWAVGRLGRQLYDGRFSIEPTPIDRYGYDYRVLCSLIRGSLIIGGQLYVGPTNWAFVPHTMNRRKRREPIRWTQPARIFVSTEPAQLTW